MNSFDNIGALSNLLKEGQTDNSGEQTQPPVSGGATVIKSKGNASIAAVKDKPANNEKNIWEAEEVPTEDSVVAVSGDKRPCPKYEISYKQLVGTEDTFLGLSDKTPLTENCTHLVRFDMIGLK